MNLRLPLTQMCLLMWERKKCESPLTNIAEIVCNGPLSYSQELITVSDGTVCQGGACSCHVLCFPTHPPGYHQNFCTPIAACCPSSILNEVSSDWGCLHFQSPRSLVLMIWSIPVLTWSSRCAKCSKGSKKSVAKSILFYLPDGNLQCILLVRSDNA